MIDAINEKISGLHNELMHSKLLSKRNFADFTTGSTDASSIPSLFISENDESSWSDTFPDHRPTVRQRRSVDWLHMWMSSFI